MNTEPAINLFSTILFVYQRCRAAGMSEPAAIERTAQIEDVPVTAVLAVVGGHHGSVN